MRRISIAAFSAPDGRLAQSGWGWIAATSIPYCLLWVMIYIKREILGNPSPQPQWYLAIYGLFFVAFSAAILFAILAYFLRFKRSGSSLLDPMQGDAYGMFLVHYPIALWLQYWLFDYDLPAIVKAAIGFGLTVRLELGADRGAAEVTGRDAGSLAVIARSKATKQSILSLRSDVDCFASLAMTREAVGQDALPLI